MKKGKLLIGFVNQFYTEQLNLGVYELSTNNFHWIYNDQYRNQLGNVFGVNGIIKHNNNFIVGYQSKPVKIGIYNIDFNLLKLIRLKNVVDLHSFTLVNDKLYCVSSGTNQIVEITLNSNYEILKTDIFYLFGNNDKKDVYHVNSIASHNNDLFVTMFGKKKNKSWKNTNNGELVNISKQETVKNQLSHPHTAYFIDNSLAYCESKTGKFILEDMEYDIKNYTRGICYSEDYIFVGSSGKRIKSRSEGTMNVDGAATEEESKSYISLINRSAKVIEDKIYLSDFGTEIYEIIYLGENFQIPAWIKNISRKDLEINHLKEKIMKQQEFIANNSIRKRIYNLFKLNL